MEEIEEIEDSISKIDSEITDVIETEETVSSQITKLNSDSKFEVVSWANTYNSYYSKNKITKPFMTKYEKAKLLGVRAQMLSNGSPALVEIPITMTSTVEIAKLELEQKKIPLMVRRYLPDRSHEDWRVEDLIVK